MHGRRVQANRERSRFGGLRCPAEVLAGQIGKTEFLIRADLPEKIRIELACDRLRVGKHDRWRGLGKPQQHIRRLDLHAFARHRLDLQRSIVVGENRAGLESAFILKKDVHGRKERTEGGRKRRRL